MTKQQESMNIEITTPSNSNNDSLIVIAALHNKYHLILTKILWNYYYHFIEKYTEAQRLGNFWI